jgi:hypothetical protein
MPDWLTRVRDLVWSAVLAAALAVAGIAVALTSENSSLAVSLGLAGITFSFLAARS